MVQKVVSNVLRSRIWGLTALFLLIDQAGYCQELDNLDRIELSFSAVRPGTSLPLSPSDFILYGLPDARRKSMEEFPLCFYGIDWITFRLKPPNKIDSIRIIGDFLPEYLTDYFEARLLSSQPYWCFGDAQKTGSLIIVIPVNFAFTSKCEQKPPAKYEAESLAIDSLFKETRPFLPKLKAVRQNRRRILLEPVWIHVVR